MSVVRHSSSAAVPGRLTGVAGTRHLDRLSTGWGLRLGALVAGVIAGAIGVLGGVASEAVGGILAVTVPVVTAPWDADEREGGAALRRVATEPLRGRAIRPGPCADQG